MMDADIKYNELKQIVGLSGKLEAIEAAKVAKLLKSYSGHEVHPSRQPFKLNASQIDPVQIKDWLTGLPVKPDESVDVVWMADGVGVHTSFQSFVENYDDFWYPSRDDVLVVGGDRKWALVLDHEELFTWRLLKG